MDPQPEDILILGRELQCKCCPPGLWASAEWNFQEFYGASCIVVTILWGMLGENVLIPEGGKIIQVLWTFHFFQAYPKQGHTCTIAGGLVGAINPKIHCKYVWQFIYVIANTELIMVSCIMLIVMVLFSETHAFCLSRSFLRTVKIA